jgi:hypothetical protein
VIKLCEIWANISDLQSGYKDRRKQKVFGTATIPSASRSKTTRRKRADRRQDGSYCGRPACPSGGDQATCPQIRGTDLKVLGFNIGAQVARDSIVPACRPPGCFPCRRLGSYHQPAATGGGLGSNNTRSPGRRQPGLEAEAAVLHGQAGPALYSIYTYHTMNGTNRTALTIYAAAGLCPARLRHASRRRGAPLIDYGGGDDGLHRYHSSAVLGASEDISPSLHPKEL